MGSLSINSIKENEYFRLMLKDGSVPPDIYIWGGDYFDRKKKTGHICIRIVDNHIVLLYPNDRIIPLEPPEEGC
jgi:hypothetical protein